MTDVIIWQRAEGALVFSAALVLFAFSGSALPWWAALIPELSTGTFSASNCWRCVALYIPHIKAVTAP